MFESASRANLRRTYLETWRKLSARLPLEPLEAQIAAVIEAHPEYIPLLDTGDAALAADFKSGRENPFLHMGMHLAIRDQVGTDRPPGIAGIHARLARELGSEHAAEHVMMEALGETLWEAQRGGAAPDDRAYLERLKTFALGTRRKG
jgi:Domain of unknown function (DUF1841)